MKTKFIYLLILGLTTIACGTSKEVTETAEDEETIPKAILVEDIGVYSDGAAVNILGIGLEQNIMTIEISYSGGCEEHNFKLVGSTMIQKSMPPRRGIKLFHNNGGDACRELIEESLRFDISDLAYPGGEIILDLEGFEKEIRYTASNQ